MDIETQIAYWKESSAEDFVVAGKLIASGHAKHGLFFLHLGIEKLLKAHVCKGTKELAPKSHNLEWLAQKAGLVLDEEVTRYFSGLTVYNIVGRYPGATTPEINRQKLQELERNTIKVREWLIKSL